MRGGTPPTGSRSSTGIGAKRIVRLCFATSVTAAIDPVTVDPVVACRSVLFLGADGEPGRLDQVWIAADLKPGQRLVEASADTQDGPAWAEGENPGDFLAGSLAALGYYGFADNGAPLEGAADWGPASAFTVRTGRGLAYRGEVRARLRGDRLDLVLWSAEAEVYAGRIETEAHAMLASLD